jgi:2'-5' RNA ligase
MKNFKTFCENYEYNSLQFDITGTLAKKIARFKIPDELLSERGGRETEPHITCKYGINEGISKPLIHLLTNFGKVKATLGQTSIFEGEDDVLKIDVISADIRRLNSAIVQNIKTIDKFGSNFQPHLTIAYMKKGTAEPYIKNRRFFGTVIDFDSISFCLTDGVKITIYLK